MDKKTLEFLEKRVNQYHSLKRRISKGDDLLRDIEKSKNNNPDGNISIAINNYQQTVVLEVEPGDGVTEALVKAIQNYKNYYQDQLDKV